MKGLALPLLCLLAAGLLAPATGADGPLPTRAPLGPWGLDARRVLEAYLDRGEDPRGLVYGGIDLRTGRAVDLDDGDGVLRAAPQGLMLAALQALYARAGDSVDGERWHGAREAVAWLERPGAPLAAWNARENRSLDRPPSHTDLFQWFGLPLLGGDLLRERPGVVQGYDALWREHARPVWLGNATAWTFDERVPNLCCAWHQAGLLQNLLAIHAVTGEPVWLERAAGLAETAWLVRDPATNLTRNHLLADGSRATYWDIIAYWPVLDAQVAMHLHTANTTYLDRARAFADALLRHAYNRTLAAFYLGVEPMGAPRTRDGLNGDTIPEFDENLLAQGLLRLHAITGEPSYLSVAKDVAAKWASKRVDREATPIGRFWSTSGGRALTIHTLLDLHLLEPRAGWPERAAPVAQDIKDRYATSDGLLRYSLGEGSDFAWAESASLVVTAFLRLDEPGTLALPSRISLFGRGLWVHSEGAAALSGDRLQLALDPVCAAADCPAPRFVWWSPTHAVLREGATRVALTSAARLPDGSVAELADVSLRGGAPVVVEARDDGAWRLAIRPEDPTTVELRVALPPTGAWVSAPPHTGRYRDTFTAALEVGEEYVVTVHPRAASCATGGGAAACIPWLVAGLLLLALVGACVRARTAVTGNPVR